MTSRPSAMTVIATLARRELVRWTRQPARMAASVGTPALIWLFLASGFAEALRPEHLDERSYALYLLPGMMTLVTVFASIFASISIIEDRAGGWLQTVLVSPAPRWTIALGRTAGGSAIAAAQALVLLFVLPFTDAAQSAVDVAMIAAAVCLTAMAMTALGLAAAWLCESTASFHSVMNLLLMPMWLLSGAFFPAAGAASWLGALMAVNPLTWCTNALREPMIGEASAGGLLGPAAFAITALVLATVVIARPNRRGWRTA